MEAAAAVAEKIRAAAAAIVPRAGQGSFEVSVCIGVAPIGRSDNPLAHALATAEIACKAAKDRGRNRVEMFQDSDQSIIRRHTDILVIGKLRDALDNDSFRLDAQPILPLRGNYGRPRFELLIRMLGDRGEIIPPGKFLSAAERYQLMPTVDRWVVRRACELLGAHTASVGEDIARFAINLSGQSLQDESFLGFVIDQIKATGVPPGVLCFELTETATIGNLAKAQDFMRTSAGSRLPVRARRFRHWRELAGVPEGSVGQLPQDRRQLRARCHHQCPLRIDDQGHRSAGEGHVHGNHR